MSPGWPKLLKVSDMFISQLRSAKSYRDSNLHSFTIKVGWWKKEPTDIPEDGFFQSWEEPGAILEHGREAWGSGYVKGHPGCGFQDLSTFAQLEQKNRTGDLRKSINRRIFRPCEKGREWKFQVELDPRPFNIKKLACFVCKAKYFLFHKAV